MIRRNHTDKNIFSDKYALKYRSKQFQQNNINREQSNKQIQLGYDQNFKAVSNNKKYHQYKEERELKIKKNQGEGKNQPIAAPLTENIYQQKNRDQYRTQNGLLKRQYKYQAKQKEEPLNVVIQKLNYEDKPIVKVPQQRHQKRNKLSLNYSYECNTDRAIVRSPTERYEQLKPTSQYDPKRKQVFTKGNPPLLEYRSSFKKERSKNVSIDFALKRERSSQHYLKTDYEPIKYEKNPINKSLLNKIQAHPLKIHPKSTIPKPRQQPSIPQHTLNSQQMCLKLHQISEFNSQINQRIKGIIGGFQSIKNKL